MAETSVPDLILILRALRARTNPRIFVVIAVVFYQDQVDPRSNHVNEALTSSGSLFGHVLSLIFSSPC